MGGGGGVDEQNIGKECLHGGKIMRGPPGRSPSRTIEYPTRLHRRMECTDDHCLSSSRGSVALVNVFF